MLERIRTTLPLLLACLVAHTVTAAQGGLPPPASDSGLWRPAPQTTWQWQLTSPVDLDIDAEVFDIDLFDNPAPVVTALKQRGRRVVCYISAGSWESWRPDAARFPPRVRGKQYVGWPRERWLDIRQIDALAPIMRARLDLCRAKGFDGVEFDNVDGYTNNTGFALTADDQLRYNTWLANEARQRGLSAGLKNDAEQVDALLPYFDWALTESCFAEGSCAAFSAFVRAGKAVLAAEYTGTKLDLRRVCAEAGALRFSVLLKNRNLGPFRRDCRSAEAAGPEAQR